jgi:hypothetical protein
MADDIETVCNRMIKDANAQLEQYEKEQKKKGVEKPNSMRVFLSQYEKSKSRTGEEQAEEVIAGRSWTCNSSHMADAARHVGPKLNGKNLTSMSALKKAVSEEDYNKFVEVYEAAMKKQGLRNYKGGTDFLHSSADPLHLELANSRLPKNDPKVEACRRAYAKATREDGKPKNKKFEEAEKTWLQAYDKAPPRNKALKAAERGFGS